MCRSAPKSQLAEPGGSCIAGIDRKWSDRSRPDLARTCRRSAERYGWQADFRNPSRSLDQARHEERPPLLILGHEDVLHDEECVLVGHRDPLSNPISVGIASC